MRRKGKIGGRRKEGRLRGEGGQEGGLGGTERGSREEGRDEKERKRSRKGEVGQGSRRKSERRDCCNIAFWNVAGLGKKNRDFWRGIEEWDVVVMMETWVEEKG